MPLTLRLRQTSMIPLEVDGLSMDSACKQSAHQVATTLVVRGNKQVPLGEYFDVSGTAQEDQTIVWQGDCSRVKRIAEQLSFGTVRVEGDAGMHLGASMRGGRIIVDGNVDDWGGAEMRGGLIQIRGSAGNSLGAVYPGGRRGMTGGTILVDQNVGDETGHTMRRGLIAVGGTIGDAAAVNMIAGSILCFGPVGRRHGAGMKRGMLGYFGSTTDVALLPTFQLACRYRPVFLQVLLRHLISLDFSVPQELFTATYQRYCGDLLETGRGEILVREPM